MARDDPSDTPRSRKRPNAPAAPDADVAQANAVRASRPTRRLAAPTPREPEQTQAAQRARAADNPQNSISASRATRRDAANRANGQRAADAAERESAPPAASRERAALDVHTVPDNVREEFVAVGKTYYFPSGDRAFRDRGRRLTTRSENTHVIRTMVEIAQARGWSEITVAGTERFQHSAWYQGRLAGLAVRGYTPTPEQEAQLVRAMHRRTSGAREEADERALSQRAAREDRRRGASTARRTAPEDQGRAASDARRDTPGATESAVWTGRLVDHGREPYKFDPHADMSYFIRLENDRGRTTLWGKDLERAIAQSLSQVHIGDIVGVRRTGQERVKVTARDKDADGHVLSEKEIETHRGAWLIEKGEFFEQRAHLARLVGDPTVAPRDAVASHPELAGTYQALRASEEAAATLNDPRDRQTFTALVRAALAQSIDRGEPLLPRQVTQERTRSQARRPERESAPAR